MRDPFLRARQEMSEACKLVAKPKAAEEIALRLLELTRAKH